MANLIDLLLSADPDQLFERPEMDLRIERLRKVLGDEFVLHLRGLTHKEIATIPKGDDMSVHFVLRAVTNLDFGNQELAARLRPSGRNTPLTPPEVVRALFLPGEIAAIEKNAMILSGYGENLVETIEKN